MIGNNIYQIVVVGEKGRLENRITEAKDMGYIGLTNFERKYLPQIAKYVNSDGFDLNSAIENIDLPKGRILGLLEKYKAKGIIFPETKVTEPEPAVDYDALVQQYKSGQIESRKALESLVEILAKRDTEISDLRKRIGKLEKKS